MSKEKTEHSLNQLQSASKIRICKRRGPGFESRTYHNELDARQDHV